MASKNQKIKQYAVLGINYLVRKLITLLPNFVSNLFGSLGWTNLIKRSAEVKFIARLYKTEYKINVRGDYMVERMATQTRPSQYDPFIGLSKLNLKNKKALDIGANVGSMSISLAALGCEKVYAIEPGPLYTRLVANIQLNKLNNIVSAYKIGLGKEAGELFWAEDKNNPGNACLINSLSDIDLKKASTKLEQSEFVKVPVVTLDEFYSSEVDDSIDIIKIDVEGMEWDVISAGKKMIKSNLPIVVAETHRVASDMMRFDCITPMFQFFYELGYSTFSLDENNELVEFIYPNFGVDTFFIHEKDLKQ